MTGVQTCALPILRLVFGNRVPPSVFVTDVPPRPGLPTLPLHHVDHVEEVALLQRPLRQVEHVPSLRGRVRLKGLRGWLEGELPPPVLLEGGLGSGRVLGAMSWKSISAVFTKM